MKIIIDAYQYSPSITGTDRMAHNFLTELQKLDTANDYIILCSNERYTRSAITYKNFKIISPPLVCGLPFLGRYFSYIWRRLNKIRLIKQDADVYYSFHNMALPGRRLARKMISSNLDLIPVMLDDYKHLGRLTPEQQLDDYKRVANLADQFISISQYSKNELSEIIGVDKSKIEVIYLAADPDFEHKNQPAETIKSKINGEYLFTIGGSESRKNVDTVVRAYKLLPRQLQEQFKLAIAGGKWHGRRLADTDYDGVVELGYVTDESLPDLYKGASAFVFASQYEGFGFTLLEAMASGTPVVNARGSSLDEVAGDATLSFDWDNPAELAERLTQLLEDKNLQDELIKKGYEQNKKFSWEKAGKQLHDVLTKD